MADENLKIRISAIDNTKKAFSAVTKGLGAVKSAVFSAKAAIGALVGAGGFAYLVKSSLNAGDQLAKTARKIGTTTEALGRLRYAAELSGISTQTLDMALQRFTRRTAEAARGTGEAKGAIRELGIDAQALLKMPLEQRMLTLANAFGQLATAEDKVRISQKLFDSEGVALVNMLNIGATALNDMMVEADTLGIVLSTTAAKGAERANDAMTKLGLIVTGLKDQFSLALAPAIEYISESIKQWVLDTASASGGIAQIGQYMAKSFVQGTITTLKSLATVKSEIYGIINTLDKSISFFQNPAAYFELAWKKANRAVVGGILEAGKATTGNIDKYRQLTDEIFALESKLNGGLLNLEDTGLSKETLDFLNGLAESIGNMPKIEFFDSGKGDNTDNSMKKMSSFADVIAATKGEADKLRDSLFDATADASGLVSSGVNAISDGLMDLMTGAKSAAAAFKSMASSIIQDLMRMYIKYMIVQPLFNAMFPNAIQPQTPAPAVTGVKANGGSVSAGQGYKVGEHGAEYFVPRVNGAIINNRDLQGGGGVTVNQSINISAGVAQTVRAEIMGLMPQITNATKAAVADARMRGGSYSKSLVGA